MLELISCRNAEQPASKLNEVKLQKSYDESDLEDIKFFVTPSSSTSVEACVAEAIEMFDDGQKLISGETKPEYTF